MAAGLVEITVDKPVGPLPEGDGVRHSVTVRDPGTLAYVDPTVLTIRVRNPDFTQSAYVYDDDVEVVRVAAGRYYIDVDLADPGTYIVRAEATGNYQGTDERRQAVKAELV